MDSRAILTMDVGLYIGTRLCMGPTRLLMYNPCPLGLTSHIERSSCVGQSSDNFTELGRSGLSLPRRCASKQTVPRFGAFNGVTDTNPAWLNIYSTTMLLVHKDMQDFYHQQY